MKSLKNKKGFTIVELVIVIAVIAILAAVLIPTFSGIVDKANESNAMQKVRNAYIDWLAGETKEGVSNAINSKDHNYQITEREYTFYVTAGQFGETKKNGVTYKVATITDNTFSPTETDAT